MSGFKVIEGVGGFGRRKQTKARSLALSKIESLNKILQHNYFFFYKSLLSGETLCTLTGKLKLPLRRRRQRKRHKNNCFYEQKNSSALCITLLI